MVRFSVASTIDTIVAELLKQKKADPFCPISIIVPHSLMARSINRKLLGSGRPLLNVYVETFYQHIARAVEPILLEIGRPLITHYEGWHLVHQASERLALKYFAVAREFSSYVHFLLGTINELRIAVPEAHIENALSALGVKGQEILHFYSAYLDGKGSCADYADMLHIYAGLPQETTLILFPDVEDSLAWVEKIALAACKSAIPITHQLSEHVPECRLKSQLFCAPEIRWTFREILRSGICLDQVALIAPTDYFKSILEEGKRLNIPIFCEEGEPFPPGARELFAAALEVINSDYDYRHLKRFLLLKQDFRTLRALIECGIAHGGDALRRAAISLAAEQANSSSLKGLLEQFSAIEKLKHDPFLMAKAILDQFIPESREKHFLLGALAEAAETIGAHEYAAWMATLADRFSRLPFSSPELKNAVLLTSKYLPGDFHHVFCLGVTEGRFPARVREDPILLDYEREMINEKTGGTLKTAREQNTQAAKSLQYSIACATKQWFASFPLMDSVSGDEYTPSFHLIDTVRATCDTSTFSLQVYEQALQAVYEPWMSAESNGCLDYLDWCLHHLLHHRDGFIEHIMATQEPCWRHYRAQCAYWSNRYNEYSGLISADGKGMQEAGYTFSATELERFMTCPYGWFVERRLGVRPLEEPQPIEGTDPLTLGTLSHSVLEQYMSNLAGKAHDQSVLYAIAERAASRYMAEAGGALPLYRDKLLYDLKAMADNFLAHEQQYLSDGRAPRYFEFAFGMEGAGTESAEPVSLTLGKNTFSLRGKIDRIDIRGSEAYILDYKHASADNYSAGTFDQGRHLQPALYAEAFAALKGRELELERISSGYLPLRGNSEEFIAVHDESRRQVLECIMNCIISLMKRGFFFPHPSEKACRWCGYAPVCGTGIALVNQWKMSQTPNDPAVKDLVEAFTRLQEI